MDAHSRPIEGFPGYKVTPDGEVWSCWSRHARPSRMTGEWHALKHVIRNGYHQVKLYFRGRQDPHSVHRLVLEAFVGPCPEGFECCHADGDRLNNRLSNLRWDTKRANAADARRHGSTARAALGRAKLSPAQVVEIRRRHAEGAKLADLTRTYGANSATIWAAVHRRSWRHVA